MNITKLPPGHFCGHYILSETDIRRLLSGQTVDLQRDDKTRISIRMADIGNDALDMLATEINGRRTPERRPHADDIAEEFLKS